MLTKDYQKAATSLPTFSTREETNVLQSVQIGGKWLYRAAIVKKCRQCRNLPQRSHWTGKRVCACGNPYINVCPSDTHRRHMDHHARTGQRVY